MRIRRATPRDARALIEFNSAMALETEDKELLPEVIGAGVRSLLKNPASGFMSSRRIDARRRPTAQPA